MPPELSDASPGPWDRLARIALPATLIGALFVFIVPLPPAILDLLLSANITMAVLILLTVLSIRSPQEFSAFPTILLATTLTRLVLAVASTRLVLTEGARHGVSAAGGVIRAFGEFVAGDQILVGVVMFAILVVIQFVVITKGATRISEVAARFMLDGLPGRQMAIDADLHAGLIDQHEAARRRDAVYRQTDFFGAMDGAGKFVRGDAVASVVIILVNIAGGLYMGVVQHGMAIGEAVAVFTKLTIGDGLVSQVPAFLISLAAGLIVTRSSAETDLNRDVSRQLFGRPAVLATAAVFLALLALTPLPKLPLLSIAGALGAGAFLGRGRMREPARTGEGGLLQAPSVLAAESAPSGYLATLTPSIGEPGSETPVDRVDELLQVDPLELEIGYRLIGLADPTRGGDLLDRIRGVRQRVARELGLIVPQVRIRDEVNLGPHQYRVKIRGAEVGQGIAYSGRLLAVPPAGLAERPDGRDGIDPITGQPAVWIHADGRELAELAGCRILEASSVVAGHFGEIVLDHADELITHEQVRKLLEHARSAAPGLVDEVVPGLLRPGEIRRVFQNLVRERVSIRDLEAILEALAEHAGRTRDVDALTESVRQALGRQITQPYRQADGRLRVVALSRSLDLRLASAERLEEGGLSSGLGSDAARGLIRSVALAVSPLVESDSPPVILCSSEARPALKDLTRTDLPRLVVLGQREIPRDTPIEVLATVDENEPEAAGPGGLARVPVGQASA
jgi:flagellar biosynthesis protein FlhA